MNTDRIEFLLEQLIDRQDDIIRRLESLESTFQSEINEVTSGLQEIGDKHDNVLSSLVSIEVNLQSELADANQHLHRLVEEQNWWGESPTLAKQVLASMDNIASAVREVDMSINQLDV